MVHQFFEFLREALVQHGYWAIAIVLLLENVGLPVPGETVLLWASFLAYSRHELQLGWVIVVATIAVTIGGELGYIVGWRGGRALLERYRPFLRVSECTLERGEALFARYGPVAVVAARFVFGIRVIAGPLAGVLHMPSRKFSLYNFLGALIWVSAISGLAYTFGSQWSRVSGVVKDLDWVLIIAVVVGLLIWWLRKRSTSAKDKGAT